MLEWQNVPTTSFLSPEGETRLVKIRHPFAVEGRVRTMDLNQRDIDHAAWQEMGTELESLRISELNAVALCEYQFDVTRIRQIQVPL